MVTKSSKTTLRKVDKPRTAMTMLKKEYSNLANSKSKAREKDLDGVKFADLEAVGYDSKMRKNLKKQAQVQKVIDSRTKANNKDLSKSLGNVTSNKGMKSANAKGTYKQAVRDLGAIKDTASDMRSRYLKSTGVGADAYGGMKRAEKNVKTQQKKVAELSKYNKGNRVPQRKK